ncbi:hypothetical protein PYW07_015581 [Mythimna separata]|uniref:Uncharacterized protein n=1 Tax=Mythimna separata TaxID=271217 RepID=A0AAD8DZ46_MYTSE|nr:hypothetical protein PYW07_015575 [Mythimna separata]KAJ8732978.1 hypothetical protein PYW07_015577 [Mythimna separata]KAJ8732979.1 hypothetical protein PYW07_015578 [Mythimna separata]KAJ8732980.1 hypothetical protein PYW07_015579 [Mythimna separata]KAJ8732981.1 hypothetical protein PYW07_015580 [Mythimna separata]
MLRRGMLPNAKRDMLFPGFPTMRHLKYQIEVPGSMLRRGMLPNAKRDMLFPGFPTMRHLKYQVSRVNKR